MEVESIEEVICCANENKEQRTKNIDIMTEDGRPKTEALDNFT